MPRYPRSPHFNDQESKLDIGLDLPDSPQTAGGLIAYMGLCKKEMLRIQAEGDEKVGQLRSEAQQKIDHCDKNIRKAMELLYIYMVKNRDELTDHGKRKTIPFPGYGSAGWRLGPPKLKTRYTLKNLLMKIKNVLPRKEQLKFIRTKEEVNKEALLQADELTKKKLDVRIAQPEYFFAKPEKLDVEVATDVEKLARVVSSGTFHN